MNGRKNTAKSFWMLLREREALRKDLFADAQDFLSPPSLLLCFKPGTLGEHWSGCHTRIAFYSWLIHSNDSVNSLGLISLWVEHVAPCPTHVLGAQGGSHFTTIIP